MNQGGGLSLTDLIRKRFWRLLTKIYSKCVISRFYLKKYLYIANTVDSAKLCTVKSNYVWTMWLQDDVPDICRFCIDSIKKYYPDVIVITEKNLSEYINIPDYVWSKYKKGIMLPAHFSDVVRVCLLDEYGGTWIDATCFMTQKIPDYITKSELFLLRSFDLKNVSNYFILSNKNNYVIHILKLFLLEYWKRENFVINYFFFHDFLINFLEYDESAKKYWQNMPFGLNLNTKIMEKVLFQDYDSDLFAWLCSTSYLHKLTYKKVKEKDINPNSLYRHLMSVNFL